jgi:hypothetical protein
VNIKTIFSIIGGILFALAFAPYILAILGKGIDFQKRKVISKERTRPQKSTWIIWATLDSIILIGMLSKRAINGQIAVAVICAWLVVRLTVKHGKPGWSKLDKLCIGGAVFGIILSLVFGNAIPGIAAGCAVLLIGSFPTFASAWKKPSNEDKTAWTIYWISCVFTMMAIPKLTFQDMAQPITFFLIESVMIYILYIHARKLKK